MADPVAKLQEVQARIAAKREENRRRFPLAAQAMEIFASFKPKVVEAKENGNYTRHRDWVDSDKVYVVDKLREWNEYITG